MSTDDWREELLKCGRAWVRYVEITKKELNLTEQAMYDAIQGHSKEERAASPDMEDVFNARDAFQKRRVESELLGQECVLIVVGYATGRDPFRLLGRVSADTGFETMPNPELSAGEMQSVAAAAKMAFYKVYSKRKRK